MSTGKPLHAVALGNTLHRLIKERTVAIPYGDAATGGQNTIGHRKTDTLSPAGDDRDPLVQIIDIHRTGLSKLKGKIRMARRIFPV